MATVAEKWNPKYRRVGGLLRERLLAGSYAPGERLPSQERLAAEYGVSLLTVRQAIELLADEGLLKGRHGVGTFVTEPAAPAEPVASSIAPAGQVALILAETAPIDGYVAETIHALDRLLRDQGRHLLVTSLWNRDVIEGVLPPSLAHPGVMGGIIEHRVEDIHIQFLQHHRVPVVVLGSHALKTPVPQVCFNQAEAMRLMCRALLADREGDAHFLFHQVGYHYIDDLIRGYSQAVREAGRLERLHVLSPDQTEFDIERRLRAILESGGRRQPFALLIHGTPAGSERIANVVERLYAEWGVDTAECPVAIYGDALLTRPELRRRFNQCGLDVDAGVATALSVLNRMLTGTVPDRTVIEPGLDVVFEEGRRMLRLTWRMPEEGGGECERNPIRSAVGESVNGAEK